MDSIDLSVEEDQFITETVLQISALKRFNGTPSIEYQHPIPLYQINPECQETPSLSDSRISVGSNFPASKGFPEEWFSNTLSKDRELDILKDRNELIATTDDEPSPWGTVSVDSGYISDISGTCKRKFNEDESHNLFPGIDMTLSGIPILGLRVDTDKGGRSKRRKFSHCEPDLFGSERFLPYKVLSSAWSDSTIDSRYRPGDGIKVKSTEADKPTRAFQMEERSSPEESSGCSNKKSEPTGAPEPSFGIRPSGVDIPMQVPLIATSLEDEIPPSDLRAQVTSFVNDNFDEYFGRMWGSLMDGANVEYDYDTSEETDTSSNGPSDFDPAFNQPISDDYVCYMSDSGESSTSSNSSNSSAPSTPSRIGSDTSGSTTSVSRSSSSHQSSGNGHREQDDDNDWPAKRRRNSGTPPTIPDVYDDDSDVKYACHYHKYDPENNPKCASFKTISLVNIIDHDIQMHLKPVQCQRCHKRFAYNQQLTKHQRQKVPCKIANLPLVSSLQKQKAKALSHIRERPNSKTWEDMYMILFPRKPIPSPYWGCSTVPIPARSMITNSRSHSSDGTQHSMVMGTSGPRTSLIRGGFNEDQYSTVEVRPPSISHSGSEHSSSTFFSSLPAQSISSPTSSIASSLNGSTELATLMRQELARLLGPELEALRQEREATERARRAADEAREAAEKRQKELAAQIYTALVGATDGYPSASPNE